MSPAEFLPTDDRRSSPFPVSFDDELPVAFHEYAPASSHHLLFS
jgi:hypothetical protein